MGGGRFDESQGHPRTQARVYRSGDHIIAVNRPALEDDLEIIDSEQARKLFGDLPVRTLQEQHLEIGQLQGKSAAVLFLMLAFCWRRGF